MPTTATKGDALAAGRRRRDDSSTASGGAAVVADEASRPEEMVAQSADERVARSWIARSAWFAAGWLAVAVGGIGVVVPGLPTTGFMIIAAACFSRSSPRFEQWVLRLPGVGRAVADYRAGLGMPLRAKITAITMMLVAVSISVVFFVDHASLRAVIVGAGAVGVWYVARRVPTAPATSTTPNDHS